MADIASISGIDIENVAKVNGISKANMDRLAGVSRASSGPSIVTDNLFFWFGPDDVTGSTANDKNAGSVGAVMSNGASVVTTLRSAGSFYTDGVNDRILAAYNTSQLPSTTAWPASVEAWLYPSSGGKNLNVISFNDDASGVDWLRLMLDTRNNNEVIYWQFYADQGQKYQWVIRDDDFPVVNGSDWIHLAATFELVNNKTVITAYMNGVSYGTATTSFTGSLNVPTWANQNTGFNLGINYLTRVYRGNRLHAYYGQAHTGDVRLYTDKLTAAEILNNYNVQKTSYGH